MEQGSDFIPLPNGCGSQGNVVDISFRQQRTAASSPEEQRRLIGRLFPACSDLLSEPALQRLSHISLSAATYTRMGKHISHSYLDKALKRLEIANQISQRLELNDVDRNILACANIVRDLGRPALGEHGSAALTTLRARPFEQLSDTISSLRDPEVEVSLALRRNGVDPLDVADILDPASPRFRRLHFILNDLSECLALLDERFAALALPECYKRLASQSTERIMHALLPRDGTACFTSAEPVQTMLGLQRILDEELTYSASALIAGDILTRGLRAAVSNDQLQERDILELTDEDIICGLPDQFRELIDDPVEETTHIISIHPEKPYSIPVNGLAPLARALRSAVCASSDSDFLFSATAPNYSRSVTITLSTRNSTLTRCTLRSEVAHAARAIAFGIPRTLGKDALFDIIGSIRRSFSSLGLDVSMTTSSTELLSYGMLEEDAWR